ncbi:MOSC domain protein [Desmospora sp. 8437]|nr:MOSC domain protein [Desmospora sp. 8437]
MQKARLLSVQVGKLQVYRTDGKEWISAIAKQAVEGSVFLGKFNLEGDGQADRKHHGGPDKAVLAYAASHYEVWRRQPDLPGIGPGGFGENLTLSDQDEEKVCIGDIYQVGEARIQVSQPRLPCWKLDRRWGVEGLARRVGDYGYSGWYLRVLEEGRVAAGQAVELVERSDPRWTVRKVNDILHKRDRDPGTIRELAAFPPLAESVRRILSNRLEGMN